MTVTLTLSQLLVGLLIVAAIVLVVFLAVAVAKLLPGLKSLSSILQDAEVLVGDAKDGVADVKVTVGKVTKAVDGLADEVNSKKGLGATISNVAHTATSVMGIIREREDREYERERREFERERRRNKN